MKKMNKALKILSIALFLLIAFMSCDKDFTSIGSDIIGGQNFETNKISYPVVTFNQKVEPVQTNALPNYLLGVYKDPTYGQSSASFLSQLTPVVGNPSFGEEPEVESVFLTIPYFSVRTEIDEDGNSTYQLDSIFPRGDDYAPMKLSIYRSDYFLRDFDPNSEFEETQLYYSNEIRAGGTINPSILEGDLLYQDLMFMPSTEEIVLTDLDENEEEVVVERLSPRIRVPLDNDYWKQAIIDLENGTELSNAANFRDYFRGIYIKVEDINGDGTMMLLDFSQTNGAGITINYTFLSDTVDDSTDGTSEDEDERQEASYVMNFSGNSVNLFDNNFNFSLTDGDNVNGDENLFLKGGEGSMAVIDLFNGVVDENGIETPAFEHFEENFGTGGDDIKRLINEAHLVFHVNRSMVQVGEEPSRVYLYDLNTQRPIVDYFFDATTNTTNPEISRIVHSEPLQRLNDEANGEGISYKIRITEHLNNILVNDSTNVKLGLVVSNNINLENSFSQYDLQVTEGEQLVDKLPVSSLISPRGTVLHGNQSSDEEKRVRLEIFYTEPNN